MQSDARCGVKRFAQRHRRSCPCHRLASIHRIEPIQSHRTETPWNRADQRGGGALDDARWRLHVQDGF